MRHQERIEPRQNACGHPCQALSRLHDCEVVIGLNAKERQHGPSHVLMLAGEHNFGLKAGLCLERQDDRRELDRLGARAHHHKHQRLSSHVGGRLSGRYWWGFHGPHFDSKSLRFRSSSAWRLAAPSTLKLAESS